MLRCGYCKMRLSRCHCRRRKPQQQKERRQEPVAVMPEPGQATIILAGSPRLQLRWWGQWKSAPNLPKTDDKAPSAVDNT
jgi:hypothetical protein